MEHARERYEVSEGHACRLLGQWRRTQRYAAIRRIDEDALSEAIIQLASEYGRYGYRRITALLQEAGWHVGKSAGNGASTTYEALSGALSSV